MSLAGSSVAPHLSCLRACGFCRPPPAARAPLARLHAAYRAAVLALLVLYLLQECVYAYLERKDMDKLSRVMFLLLCHVTSLAKQIVFLMDAADVNTLVASLDGAEYNPSDEVSRSELLATATASRRLQGAFAGTAVLTCSLWAAFPILYHVRGDKVEFPIYVPADYNSDLMFWMVLLYTWGATTLVGVANTTMDAFIAAVLQQCCTQLRLLRGKFENITQIAQLQSKETGKEYERTLMQLFVRCLHHYADITRTARYLEEIFGTAMLIQFGIGGWILCMAGYKIVSLNVLSIEFASMCLFISCILTELYLYCYYGNELTVESERLVQALYASGWVPPAPRALRHAVLMTLLRASRPLRPAAASLVPLSLETFIKILKSSYTFYAVLRQTK